MKYNQIILPHKMSPFSCCARIIKFKKINNNNVLPHKMSNFCCAGKTNVTKKNDNNHNHNYFLVKFRKFIGKLYDPLTMFTETRIEINVK